MSDTFPPYIVIKVKRPEGYEDVHADIVAQDFLETGRFPENHWEFEVVDSE